MDSIIGMGWAVYYYYDHQIEAYVAFMRAKIAAGLESDSNSIPKLKTPENVNEIWNGHILYEEEYAAFCLSVGAPGLIPFNTEWDEDYETNDDRTLRTNQIIMEFTNNRMLLVAG